ncbi:MAG: phage major capsid protein [Actinomycetia bacterium]|nr:phage major capsid protein [Actinomycetes bacterium]
MALTNLTAGSGLTQIADAFTPEDLGKLIDVALKGESVAARAFTVASTDKDRVRYPKLTGNPAVAHYEELDEITLDDPDTDEVVVDIHRTAGATRQSRELAEDSTPDTAALVGKALTQQIVRSVDAAALANTTSKGPDGLLSTSYTPVVVPALTNLDAFVSAVYASQAQQGEITAWIVSPEVAEAVSKLKDASESNKALIDFVEDGLRIVGRPVIVSTQVDAATGFWGISQAHNVLVIRTGTAVERSTQSAFLNYAVDVMANFRYGVGFLHEPANVRGFFGPVTYDVTATGDGTFTVKVNGVETAAVAEDVSAADLKTAIVAVDDGILADDVTVTGSAGTYEVTIPAVLAKGTDTGSTVSTVAVA